ncbi:MULTISPECIES: DUF7878 domain-containing protein [Gilliamella]|jgi:hypothetical protein|uniref:DUF7878 domain-containing protein n=1 Tax=Gilliamella intestini TaxID=1798183 RepID=A0A1C4DL32_9GAMM|nr:MULTISPECIES: hypothetical protein [Gilliamella]OCG47387.1 hypothetical protein A9G35_03965 [Gilliamella apicola]SCC32099.1 hypothetical protein GA0061080_10826 [Gilliamella intestini]
MERIPCEFSVEINYTDLNINNITSGPQLFSEVEGQLLIYINNKVIFSEKEILLLELAKQLKDWLHNYDKDFYYESMDYEDSPILFFKRINLNNWQISGIWMNRTYANIKLSDLMFACNSFIDKLIIDLNLREINTKDLF